MKLIFPFRLARWFFLAFVCLLTARSTSAQKTDQSLHALFTEPLHYVVQYTPVKLKIDGFLNEKAWLAAPWTTEFVDIEGALKPLPALPTKVKMLWSDDYLYVAAELAEPQVWGMQQNHDDVIFRDNDFEVFIDPNNTTHRYFEIEINALNKIFDLFMNKPYRNGGDALIGWNATGLQTAVKVHGTLNKYNDHDRGWTVEMAIPLKSMWFGYPFKTPQEGATWRINFSRVEWDTQVVNGKIVKMTDSAGHNRPEHNWVWSPQGVINMHYPERWGYLQFTKTAGTAFAMPENEKLKPALWTIYYQQKQYFARTGRYAGDLADLELAKQVTINAQNYELQLQATATQFKAGIGRLWINDEGLIQTQQR